MGLIDDATRDRRLPDCKIAHIRDELPADEKGELDQLLDRHDISTNTIIKVLGARGLNVSIRTVNLHRYARACQCFRGYQKPGRRGGDVE